MKYYKLFFILFTIAELVFSLCYYLLVKKVDKIIYLGGAIYVGGMIVGYIAYHAARNNVRRKSLLDSLPNF